MDMCHSEMDEKYKPGNIKLSFYEGHDKKRTDIQISSLIEEEEEEKGVLSTGSVWFSGLGQSCCAEPAMIKRCELIPKSKAMRRVIFGSL